MTERKSKKPAKVMRKTATKPALLWRQPADRQSRWRCARAGLHRGDAGLEARGGAAYRCPHRAHCPRGTQGRKMELAVLRRRKPGLVSEFSLLHEIRQSDFLPRHLAAPTSA